MSRKVSADALPRVQLTPDDELQIRTLAAQLQRELLLHYEDFAFRCKRNVDLTRWKHVRSEDALHAYREMENMAHSPLAGAAAVEMPQAKLAAQSKFPRVMCTGTINGTLDDIMYGIGYYDTPSIRAHWAYQNGFMEDSAVLSTIDSPTAEDPFRFLGVVWFLKTFAGVPTAVLKNRDSLKLNAIHTTTLPRSGEQIGIYISHSIPHRDLPELRELSTVRASISVLMVMRQMDASRIEIFIIDFMDTKGNTPVTFHLKESVRTLLGVTMWCDIAISKKLYWMLLLRHRRNSTASHDSTSTSGSDGTDGSGPLERKRPKVCELCNKNSVRSVFGSSGHRCKLCDKRVCSTCGVTRSIVLDARTKNAIVRKPFSFCLCCVMQVAKTSTAAIAREEHQDRASPRQNISMTILSAPLSTTSSTSSSASKKAVFVVL